MTAADVYAHSVTVHRKFQGKIATLALLPVQNNEDLALAYTPGVAQVCREIVSTPAESFSLTWRGRTVAIISDGSAVLGLGNIGPEAAMPVMEGKALLLTQFGGVSAVPIVTTARTEDELVDFVKKIAPSFGAINLEDIAAPVCIEIEDRLQDIGIPVFHDDQHGTAIVVRAAVSNAAKVTGKKYEDLEVTISGAGAAGLAIAQMLLGYERKNGALIKIDGGQRVRNVKLVDSQGLISSNRDGLAGWKAQFERITNRENVMGGLAQAVKGSDVFIGVSRGGLLTKEMVESMASHAVVLAMANPDPEILPDEAKAAGAVIVGTGRSDYPNQVNNSLAFPGIFRGALRVGATKITTGMKLRASETLAAYIEPRADKILPSMFDPGLAEAIAAAVAEQAKIEGVVRKESYD